MRVGVSTDELEAVIGGSPILCVITQPLFGENRGILFSCNRSHKLTEREATIGRPKRPCIPAAADDMGLPRRSGLAHRIRCNIAQYQTGQDAALAHVLDVGCIMEAYPPPHLGAN
jgi:hypothetical protein